MGLGLLVLSLSNSDDPESRVTGGSYPRGMAHLHLTDPKCRRESTVGSFVANLPEMLGAMASDPRVIITIVTFSDGRYWQCRADKDSNFIIEIVSNLNIPEDAHLLSELEERRLRDLGFLDPSKGPYPNWRIESSKGIDLVGLVALTCTAVYDVLCERPQNGVEVRTFEFQSN